MDEKFDLTVATSNQSWSKSIIDTVAGSHNFTLIGYSLIKGIGHDKYISSEIFNVGGYDWAVYFYPDGKHPKDLDTHVSVFVVLASEGTDVRALYEIKVMDQSGNEKHLVISDFNCESEWRPTTFKSKGSMWGSDYELVKFESPDYIKNDSFEIHCEVGVIRRRLEGSGPDYIEIPPSNIGIEFKYLLDSGFGTDITFSVGDEKFKAHKLILSTCSSVFKALFAENPNQTKAVIADIEPAVFKLMLEYIYSSDLSNTCEFTKFTNTMHRLLEAAVRYDLERLRLFCESKLVEEINIDNVATTLCLAEQHRCLQLKALCIKFVLINLEAVKKSKGYRYLEESFPSLVSEISDTSKSEGPNLNTSEEKVKEASS